MIEYIIVNKRTGEVMEGVERLSEAIEIRNQYNEMGKDQDACGNNEYYGEYEIRQREY